MTDDDGQLPLIDIWRTVVANPNQAWVLFRHGTCVTLDPGEAKPGEHAVELMQTWGRVIPGTDAGDFDVTKLESDPGWVVTCHYPSIRTYVGPDEIGAANPSEVVVGLTGRSKRDLDARELEIIHIQTSEA